MSRLFALSVLIGSLAVSAAPPPPNPMPMPDTGLNEQQKCQMKCGEVAAPCLMACAGDDPDESVKPENNTKTMVCAKKCAQAQAPCMKACDAKKGK